MWPRAERRFADRIDAGRQLAVRLDHLRSAAPLVLGLPRGGVEVAFQVARALDAPLDVIVARKLGAPHQPELAIGAIAPGATVLRRDLIEALGLRDEEVDRIAEREQRRAEELEVRLRHGRPRPGLAGRSVIVVDDGLATGATATAAVRSARASAPARIVLAVPVAAPESVAALEREADEVVALLQPEDMHAVGLWYESFPQLGDEAVEAMLEGAGAGASG